MSRGGGSYDRYLLRALHFSGIKPLVAAAVDRRDRRTDLDGRTLDRFTTLTAYYAAT